MKKLLFLSLVVLFATTETQAGLFKNLFKKKSRVRSLSTQVIQVQPPQQPVGEQQPLPATLSNNFVGQESLSHDNETNVSEEENFIENQTDFDTENLFKKGSTFPKLLENKLSEIKKYQHVDEKQRKISVDKSVDKDDLFFKHIPKLNDLEKKKDFIKNVIECSKKDERYTHVKFLKSLRDNNQLISHDNYVAGLKYYAAKEASTKEDLEKLRLSISKYCGDDKQNDKKFLSSQTAKKLLFIEFVKEKNDLDKPPCKELLKECIINDDIFNDFLEKWCNQKQESEFSNSLPIIGGIIAISGVLAWLMSRKPSLKAKKSVARF